MPVWVQGNKSSNVFIIYLHGGPGGSAIADATLPGMQPLVEEYVFVSYDQRGAGAAQGNAKPEAFTVEQFVEDLEKIVHLIRHKYNNPTIFLFGASWGGALGTACLLKPENQQYMSGWIDMCGGHNFEEGMKLSWEWVENKAQEKINAGIDVKYWEEELDWYSKTEPLFRWDGFKDGIYRHTQNIGKLDGYVHNPSKAPQTSLWTQLVSPQSVFSSLFANLYSTKYLNIEKLNMTSELHKITIPSIVLWGRHDGILPVPLAQEAYDNLGSSDKYIHIFENSGHVIPIDEPELLVEKIKEFIEMHK